MVVSAGFLFPVIEGKIYKGKICVGQRGTPPNKGLYGPIGGKAESFNSGDEPYVKRFPAEPHVPRSDIDAKARGIEFGHASAIREYYEEAYQMFEVDSETLEKEVTRVFKIGVIRDKADCFFYLATIARDKFDLSPRELLDLMPLEDVSISELFPLAKASLFGMKYDLREGRIDRLRHYVDMGLESQIPDFDPAEILEIMEGESTTINGLVCLGASR